MAVFVETDYRVDIEKNLELMPYCFTNGKVTVYGTSD